MGAPLKAAVQSGAVSESKLDDSVSRILTQMYKFGLFDHMDQWNGTAHSNDVTSIAHSTVARNVSAAATVLLKNDGVLPIKAGVKIVLIGGDATNPTVHGGGSGSVAPTYVISPVEAISVRNGGKYPHTGGGGGGGGGAPINCTIVDHGFDYFVKPSVVVKGTFNEPMDCCQACGKASAQWSAFTLTSGTRRASPECWCHQSIGEKRQQAGYVSGTCRTVQPTPTPSANGVSTYTGGDPSAAGAAAAAADVAVVFVSTVSSEGSDR